MKITFLGAAHEVTGSCTLLSACGKSILIDCGMEQGADVYQNETLPVAPGSVDYVFLTHAHIDHSGNLPLLHKHGFQGPIYATAATTDLCRVMLLDSAHIQESDAEWKNRKAMRSGRPLEEPVYTAEDAQRTCAQFVPCGYNRVVEVCEGISIRMVDVGHLLGSASVEVTVTEEGKTWTLVFSGDIGNLHQPLIRDPQYMTRADYVVMESTYGDRSHGEAPDTQGELVQVIQRTLDRGGNVVIPSFAVGRTQEMLYYLRNIKQNGLVHGHDGFPVYVDSPLAIEATNIFTENTQECADEDTMALIRQGINPLSFDGLRVAVTAEESKLINENKEPKIIISASGMCDAGRVRHHLKHNLWRPECTVLFVGYQSPGTLGRVLADGEKTVKLFGESIEVQAEIASLHGISGHADNNGLMKWIGSFTQKPRHVFIVHGEDKVATLFAARVHDDLGLAASAPYSGESWNLATDEKLSEGNQTKLEKPAPREERPTQPALVPSKRKRQTGQEEDFAYAELLRAGERITELIAKMRDASRKEKGRLAKMLNAISHRF